MIVKLSVFVLVFALAVNSVSIAQQKPDKESISRQIVVMFDSNVFSFEQGKNEALKQDVTVRNDSLKTFLETSKVSKIAKAFPQFTKQDRQRRNRKGKTVNVTDRTLIYILTVQNKEDVPTTIETIESLPGVLFAEPHQISAEQLESPNDPLYTSGNQWNLHNTGQSGGTSDADIDAPEAWDITTGSNVIVSVIDGGIRSTHNDLTGRINGDAGYDQTGIVGHGTRVAGVIAAEGDNNSTIAGINWNARLNSQVIDWTFPIPSSEFANAVDDAVTAGVAIINASWKSDHSTLIQVAFADAYNSDIVNVAAAGNVYKDTLVHPAGYNESVIAVSGTNRLDALWTGTGIIGSSYGNHIDVSAPASEIYSTDSGTDTDYEIKSGTSYATAHVSGIASLLLSVNSNLYNDDIRRLIEISAEDRGVSGWDQKFGHGRVNARSALDFVKSGSDYSLYQQTASSGTDYSTSGYYEMRFYGDHPGIYCVKRNEVRKNVTLNYLDDYHIWGRGTDNGQGTLGYRSDTHNYTTGFTEVVSHTRGAAGIYATLRTYVYEYYRYNGLGQIFERLGWFPATPQNVTFAYTVIGKPVLHVYITGDDEVLEYTSGTWTANIQHGSSPFSYQWYYKENGQSSWSTGGTSSSYTRHVGPPGTFQVKCVVTDNDSATDEEIYYVFVKEEGGPEKVTAHVPDKFGLSQNYPNPFNPVTTIKFQLPEASFVKLIVYNINGQEVARLVETNMEAGYHETDWDASSVASGIYLYKITAGNFTQVKRMVVVK